MANKFTIDVLGECKIKSPIKLSHVEGDGVFDYITDEDRVIVDVSLKNLNKNISEGIKPESYEKAGPREHLYFNPQETHAAIVTCGGLCPGLNDVIRGLVMQLFYRYKVTKITGIKFGYEGFITRFEHPTINLSPQVVDNIHLQGGSILGSSRGDQDICEIVNRLEELKINILFCIGGDGTLKGAHAIHNEIKNRQLPISVGCLPKTIDNDINLIQRSFGFETAFSKANEIIKDAHNEAEGAYNGVAIIKLMGRDSGFIAAHAALSMAEVNFVIIPELDFDLYGDNGFLNHIKKRLKYRNHALIVVSEGAGQAFFENENAGKDASGNVKYKDIGIYLKEKISEFLKKEKIRHSVKYIDPSYIIRSAPANANDRKFCSQLAQNAVHAAMAGRTNFVIGYWNNQFTLLPIQKTIQKRKTINLESELWWNVLETTGQPVSMKNI